MQNSNNAMNESIFGLLIDKKVVLYLSHYLDGASGKNNSFSLSGIIKKVHDGFLDFEENFAKIHYLININHIIGIKYK